MTTLDLTALSGLPIAIDLETGHLADLTGEMFWEGPGQRRFGDLRAVVATPEAVAASADTVAYFTYRDVRLADESGLGQDGLRYDVTVTLPGEVGGEFVKTAGHYHALDSNGVSWPEIYDVLAGEAAFVLQRAAGDPAGDPAVDRAIVIVAEPGDRVVIPPDYGHVTVNIGTTPLVVADLVAAASTNHYQGYAARRGGAIRIMAVPGEDDAFEAEWNHAYPEVDDGIEVVAAADLDPFHPGTPLYTLGVEHPELVAFLTNPTMSRISL
ncbi:MAG: glucose-6-phosphate isomerase family protein [Thermomicrobiales bacterium]